MVKKDFVILISVLMPVYNEVSYVKDAIDSVLSQDVEFDIEVCVVDDLSTDNTYEYVKSIYKEDKRVKIYKTPVKGKVNAINHAYVNANGDFFVILAGDDILELGSLEQRIYPLINASSLSITLCKLRTFSEKKKYDGVLSPKDTTKGSLSGGCMAISKSFTRKIFPIPNVLGNEDSWIVCCLEYFDNVEIIHVPIVGINYRIHEKNSVPRDGSFKNKNVFLHHRFIAYSIFLEKYRKILNKKTILELEAISTAETLRHQTNTISILFMSNLPFIKRSRMILYSNKFLFWIYNRFVTFL